MLIHLQQDFYFYFFNAKMNLSSFELISLIVLVQWSPALPACRPAVINMRRSLRAQSVSRRPRESVVTTRSRLCFRLKTVNRLVWRSTTDSHLHIFAFSQCRKRATSTKSSIAFLNSASSSADEASKWRHALPDAGGDPG